MNYLPYWNIDNTQKKYYRKKYYSKYGHSKAGFMFSIFWWKHYFQDYKYNSECFEYYNKLELLPKSNITKYTLKNILPNHLWKFIPYFYYELTEDPVPLWGFKNDLAILELFQLACLLVFTVKHHVDHYFLLNYFCSLLGLDEWCIYFVGFWGEGMMKNTENYFKELCISFGWNWNQNLMKQKEEYLIEYKKQTNKDLKAIGINPTMCDSIVEDLIKYHEYNILKS